MLRYVLTLLLLALFAGTAAAQIVDKQKLLDNQTFWDNRDWDWYQANIPFLDTPDADINSTYYYRWEVVTKHLTYGSPKSGYSYTEFIDRPFWSGAYGAISCPAGHQLYEVRWLRNPRYAQDYARYWFRTPGAQPRNYSTWLADAVWAVQMAQGDEAFAKDLLDDLQQNFAAWEARNYVPDVGLFWQTGHDDGMEFNINSRQSKDILRGAPGYRPSFNAYMYADAMAIAKIARLAGDEQTAATFQARADKLKRLVQEKLWDPRRQFFFPMLKNDEEKDGHVSKALTLTYQTGQYAGSEHGRELIGYVPWQFNLPDQGQGFEAAWKFLLDRDYFAADFGPTVTERHDPQFLVTDHCCWWSGQSWPYATTQTLVGMANLLNNYEQQVVTKDDYYQLLRTYSLTQRKAGRPYIAEAANPDTGSWKGYDNYNHSEHYFHSGYCDLVITGLMGLRPRADDTLEVNPLAPPAWDYFALVDTPYKGRSVSIVWDRTGQRYGQGAGLRLIVDGKTIATSDKLQRLTAKLPKLEREAEPVEPPVFNFAVNNDGAFFPRMTASFSSERTSPMAAQDGNYWYHISPPNRWTTEGSTHASDWLAVDFGTPRDIQEVVLYFLDDGEQLGPPASLKLEYLVGEVWEPVPDVQAHPATPVGRRANHLRFQPITAQQLRVTMTPVAGSAIGISEFEAWGAQGDGSLDPPARAPSLATNAKHQGFPQVSASYTSRFDRVESVNDGVINYRPVPNNRWTTYESTNLTDWLEIDFGEPQTVGRIELHIYDDRGGVQAPDSYTVEYLDGDAWKEVAGVKKSPEKPQGGAMNTATFEPLKSRKVRVVFTHAGRSRTGLTEIEAWEK
jgi:hypothetical protein